MCRKWFFSVTLAVFVLVTVPAATHAQVENLLSNPSFEEDEVILDDPEWLQWATWGYEDGLQSTVEIDETEFIDGKRSLKVIPTGTTNWYFIVLNLPIYVDVDKDYTISFWAKAEEPRALTVQLKATDNSINAWGATDFELTTEWAEYHYASEVMIDNVKLEILCSAAEIPFWLDFVYMYEGDYIEGIMPGGSVDVGKASGPDPDDGALINQTWYTLNWTPGEFAVSHDVYIGDNYDDVLNGAGDTFRGNQVPTFFTVGFPGFPYPEGLVPGATYYWRIDAINEADPNSPWKGNVWSFSVAPRKAYNPDPINGAEFVDLSTRLSWTAGMGAMLHTVYFGEDYDEVSNATQGVLAGSTSYDPGPLEREKVYYWRVDEFDAVETHKGDVWTFTTPGAVGNPQPANGAVNVSMTPLLTWTAADNATSHELYLGLDKETVRHADADSPEHKGSLVRGLESYDPGKLAWDTTYYWRVDEFYPTNTVKGPVWTFTTADFIAVDDFESYTDNDAAGEAIWQTWIDGFGVPDNGAQVGYLLPPYAEQRIVHGGVQSMPLFYTNEAGVTNSEASLTLTAARDWTEESVGQLSLWFRGHSDNAAEPVYVAICNTGGAPAVVACEDTNAAQLRIWNQWVIPLQAFADQGIDLTDVDTMAIGVGSQSGRPAVGGAGTLYIDDIRLHRP
jgi:hypothetical protein